MGHLAIFRRFLRFGCLAFGGPVAQIAMVRRELVDQEAWISSERFNRLLAVYQLLPGPEAHELCVHLGRMKGGRWGGFLAGLGFMLPGFLIVLGLAVAYSRMDLTHPLIAAALLGAQVAVVVMVAVAVPRIGRHILTKPFLYLLAAAAFACTLFGVSFWLILLGAILVHLIAAVGWKSRATLACAAALGVVILLTRILPSATGQSPTLDAATLAALFAAGLKGGMLTFGGAYTAIPFVRNDAVGRGWLSDGQFLDGLALSGMVPAPLVIFVTFVGYVSAGLAGALAMTVGMFLPAFSFGLLFYDRLEQVVEDDGLHQLLDAVAAAVVGIIAATAADLAWRLWGRLPLPIAGAALFIACLCALSLIKSRWTALWLIPAAMAGGALLFRP